MKNRERERRGRKTERGKREEGLPMIIRITMVLV
jgi:hypothetical protein